MSKALETALAAVSVGWRHRAGTPFVEAYSPKLKGWAVVAEGRDTPELRAHDIAALIVSAVNGDFDRDALIDDLAQALENSLNDKLDFSTEQEADEVLRRAGARAGTEKPDRHLKTR